MRPQELRFALAHERRTPGQAADQHTRQRILVRPPIHGLRPDLLRRKVVERPHELAGARGPRTRARRLRQPEVRQIRSPGAVDEDVAGLHIPVDEPLVVRRVEGIGHLRSEI